MKANSLVLYKTSPARILKIADKIEIEVKGGETIRVRPKDIELLHPGPIESFAALVPKNGEIADAWEILQGNTTKLSELAELAFGEYTPATAWAAWQLVTDGLYFTGTPDAVIARPKEEFEKEKSARESDAAEKEAWAGLVQRIRSGTLGHREVALEELRHGAVVPQSGQRHLRLEHCRVGAAVTPR